MSEPIEPGKTALVPVVLEYDAEDGELTLPTGSVVGCADGPLDTPIEDNALAFAAHCTQQVPGLVEALKAGRRAIGDHNAPSDCYATGPSTGDDHRDLVECPACSFIAMYTAALAAYESPLK